MKKRKIKTQSLIVSGVMLAISYMLLKPVVEEVLDTVQLSRSIKEVETQLQVLEAENGTLAQQKAKLQDPEYVKSYARATYMLTKEGEQIYYLPK